MGALQWLVHNAKKCLGELPQQIHHFATNKSKKYTEMKDASKAAGKSKKKFLKLFEENVKKEVRKNPELLRKSGWEK